MAPIVTNCNSPSKVITQLVKAWSVITPVASHSTQGNRLVIPVGNGASANSLFLDHSSTEYNTIIIAGYLIAIRDLLPSDDLFVNFNQFQYTVSHPFVEGKDVVAGFGALSETDKQSLYKHADEKVREEALRRGFIPSDDGECVAVLPCAKEGALIAHSARGHEAGDTVFTTTGTVLPFPLRSTVTLPSDTHLRLTGGVEFLWHSCQPNLAIQVKDDTVVGVALRPINPNEMLTYNYLTTEWDIACPFRCTCGAPSCHGLIQGFKYLGKADQQALLPLTSDAVRAKLCDPLPSSSRLANFAHIAHVGPNKLGEVVAQTTVHAGTVLFEVQRYQVRVRELIADDIRIPHSCNPSAVLVEGRLVARATLMAGDCITVNVSLLMFTVPIPFSCHCGSANCQGIVSGFDSMNDDEKDAMMNLAEPAVRAEATRNGYVIRSSSPYVTIHANGEMGQATFAAKAVTKGTRFFHTAGLVIPFPTVYTILLAENKHLLFAGGAQCLAHSCNPNVRVVVDPANSSFDCIALRDIAEGDLISFNYLTTEWDMNTPFPCLCGDTNCFHSIRGFKHLNDAQRQKLWFYATPVIRAQVCAVGDSLWKNMDRSVAMDCNGILCALTDIPTGKTLTKFQRSRVNGHGMLIDDMRLSHSCDPNSFLVSGRLVSIRPILSNEEITVNVSLVEYDLGERTFDCPCGTSSCAKKIGGFASLSDDEKHRLMIYADPAVRVVATAQGYQLRTSCELISIRANGDMGQSTFAAKPITKGTRFFRSTGLVVPFPTVYTILLAPGKNLLFAGGAHCLAHSCNPNVRVVVDATNSSFDCVALHDIAENELVSFNYLTTEWDMDVPFPCLCGASSCFRMIRGFKYLNGAERAALGELPTSAVKELAGMYQPRPLNSMLKARDGVLFATEHIPRASDLLSCEGMEVFPTHILMHNVVVRHSNQSNTVYVEGHLISVRDIEVGEPLTVNMCYFVYDMVSLFPDSYHEENKGFKYLPESVKQHDLYLCEPPVRAQAMRDGWIVVSTNSDITIRQNGDMGQTAYAAKFLPRNTLLFHTAKGLIVPFPTMYTICVGKDLHLLFGDAAECIAHSCDPNVQVVVRDDQTLEFVAVKDVEEGAMLSFCYNTTEWSMNSPFPCLCESPHCARYIHGFQHLNDADRQRLWHLTSTYVKSCAQH